MVEYTQTYHLLFILHEISPLYIHIKSYPQNFCSIYLSKNQEYFFYLYTYLQYVYTHIGLWLRQDPKTSWSALCHRSWKSACRFHGCEWRMANGCWGVKMIGTIVNPDPTRRFQRTNPNTVFLRIPTRASGTEHALLNRSRWSFVYQGEFGNLLSIRAFSFRSVIQWQETPRFICRLLSVPNESRVYYKVGPRHDSSVVLFVHLNSMKKDARYWMIHVFFSTNYCRSGFLVSPK